VTAPRVAAMARSGLAAALALASCGALAGCYLSHERGGGSGPLRDGGAMDAPTDARADAPDARVLPPCTVESYDVPIALDLLLVVDNSGSMAEEQVAVRENVGALVDALVRGDSDGDGVPDTFPARDLHVGVLTVGVLTGPPGLPGTDAVDDGSLFNLTGIYSVPGCRPPFPRYLPWLDAAGASRDMLLHDLDCVLHVGIGGSGIEQPLEATLKGLSPRAGAPVEFLYGRGRGDTDNAGFLRPDSILAVLVVTDEDDCSVADPSFLDRFRGGV